MTSPVYHAESSVRLFGGDVADYLPIHNWFDASKEHHPDIRHRALRHHSLGIFQAEREFGEYIYVMKNDRYVRVPVRYIGEQHCVEDLGSVPKLSDWLELIPIQSWMTRGRRVTRRQDVTRGND